MDVLGTKELATDDGTSSTLLKLDKALEAARKRSQLDESWNWTDSAWFSDNLAIAAPLGKDPLEEEGIIGTILVAAMWLQYLLAVDGFFTRGGLTVGQHFMDQRVNFGPALVQAVQLEAAAIQPRIILDDLALDVVQFHASHYAPNGDSPFEAELMVDQDDMTFISYLAVAHEADDLEESVYLLDQHRKVMTLKLDKHRQDEKLWNKYLWVAEYHNAFCNTFQPGYKELLIPLAELGRAFTVYIPERS